MIFSKILSAVLILLALYMGVKQGWAMLSGKAEMLALFGRWHFGPTGVAVLGAFTLIGAVLVLFPITFLWGNFLTASTILLIIAEHAQDRNLKGVAIELPFLLLSLVILYLHHPLAEIAAAK
jgi:hypothetical protein